jgi:hypothetical protein
MASITVTKELAAPAATIWALLADFGNVSWIPMAPEVVVEGSGPGMRRHIRAGESAPVVERLVSVDAAERTLRYSIDENNPLPVRRYEATVRVSPAGGGRTAIRWDASFEPTGDETEAANAIQAIYGMMATWLETAAKGAR